MSRPMSRFRWSALVGIAVTSLQIRFTAQFGGEIEIRARNTLLGEGPLV